MDCRCYLFFWLKTWKTVRCNTCLEGLLIWINTQLWMKPGALSHVLLVYAWSVLPLSAWNIHWLIYLQPNFLANNSAGRNLTALQWRLRVPCWLDDSWSTQTWECSHLSRFWAEIIRLNTVHTVLALHQSSSSSWNMIARTLIWCKMVCLEWCIIISSLEVSTHMYVSTILWIYWKWIYHSCL